jgi:hypothetical protein
MRLGVKEKMRALVVAVALGACHGVAQSLLDAAATDDAPPDAPTDAPVLPDPWTAPTGAPIAGATLADGWTDLRALPPPMAIEGGWTDSLFAQADGTHLLFGYWPVDFFQFYQSAGMSQVVTGPPLLGTEGSGFKLFDGTLTSAGWVVARDPVASPDPSLVEASPATNASGDIIVFTRYAGPSAKANLMYATFAGGVWSTPVALPINSVSCNDDNAKVVGEVSTGVTLYFESNRSDLAGTGTTCGQRTVYMATLVGGVFSPVVPIPGVATATSDDSQPFTADQQSLYWSTVRGSQYGVFVATLGSDGSFGDAHAVVTPTTAPPVSNNLVLVGEPSIIERPQGSLLYLMCGVAYDEHGGQTYFDADNIRLVPCVARRPKL